MRIQLTAVALFLAACGPQVPDSGPGVGFGDYETYSQEQAARAAGSPSAGVPVTGVPGTVASAGATRSADGSITLDDLASAGIGAQPGAVAAPPTGPAATPPGFPRQRDTLAEAGRSVQVEASPTNAAPVLVNNPGLSDEQDFDAVSDRRSIEGDAARLEQAQANYRVVQGNTPERTQDAGPNIVAYALQTTNARGQQIYRRFAPSQGRFQRNCAEYRTPDAAQRDFLARGGPERDRRGLDPDGDGFACGWDPAPFRAARG
ncbi:hypothetical protein [Histidinibacterium aquaticum]|uniref:Excalibur calcium-binding domain-containing protein n=1 Tax=Histidinibacterium aquaticum TaxID=2613962 RepID=A0A5J5GQ15_9RHOB|nr:hypothetical protein [Histidinibacterium aquaticum]KAA9010147.1 hypothetical protein F3S47_02530 [Histidinibacterium aquaticum]